MNTQKLTKLTKSKIIRNFTEQLIINLTNKFKSEILAKRTNLIKVGIALIGGLILRSLLKRLVAQTCKANNSYLKIQTNQHESIKENTNRNEENILNRNIVQPPIIHHKQRVLTQEEYDQNLIDHITHTESVHRHTAVWHNKQSSSECIQLCFERIVEKYVAQTKAISIISNLTLNIINYYVCQSFIMNIKYRETISNKLTPFCLDLTNNEIDKDTNHNLNSLADQAEKIEKIEKVKWLSNNEIYPTENKINSLDLDRMSTQEGLNVSKKSRRRDSGVGAKEESSRTSGYIDELGDEINIENGSQIEKQVNKKQHLSLDDILNDIDSNKPMRDQARQKRNLDKVMIEILSRRIKDEKDKAEIERRTDQQIGYNRQTGGQINRAVVKALITKMFKLEKAGYNPIEYNLENSLNETTRSQTLSLHTSTPSSNLRLTNSGSKASLNIKQNEVASENLSTDIVNGNIATSSPSQVTQISTNPLNRSDTEETSENVNTNENTTNNNGEPMEHDTEEQNVMNMLDKNDLDDLFTLAANFRDDATYASLGRAMKLIHEGKSNEIDGELKQTVIAHRDLRREARKLREIQTSILLRLDNGGKELRDKLLLKLNSSNDYQTLRDDAEALINNKKHEMNTEQLILIRNLLENLDETNDTTDHKNDDQVKSNMSPKNTAKNSSILQQKSQTEQPIELKSSTDELKRLESSYKFSKYCVKISSEGMADMKYAGNLTNRLREIKGRSNASRILSSSINGCITSKQVYSKVETDSVNDFVKLLEPWPKGSFGCDTTTAEREFVSVKVEVKDVDRNIKLEQEKETLKQLREIGIRNIKRATRFDQAQGKLIELNKIECNPRDLAVLKSILTNGLALECTKRNHDVEIHIERINYCKHCSSIGHRSKGCNRPMKCCRCSSKQHVSATCPGTDPLRCPQCNMGHEGGTGRCRSVFEENYKLNETSVKFLINECGKQNAFVAMGVPVPEGMNVDEEIIALDDNESEKRDEMYEIMRAYLNTNESKDPELKREVENLKVKMNNHDNRISIIESDISGIKTDMKTFREEMNTKLERIDDQFKVIREEHKRGLELMNERFEEIMEVQNESELRLEKVLNDQSIKFDKYQAIQNANQEAIINLLSKRN